MQAKGVSKFVPVSSLLTIAVRAGKGHNKQVCACVVAAHKCQSCGAARQPYFQDIKPVRGGAYYIHPMFMFLSPARFYQYNRVAFPS